MSKIPRLTGDEFRPDLAAALGPRIERLGYLGEFFSVAGHQPDALLAFNALTAALKDVLPGDLTEVVALTVAVRMHNDYERNQHERLATTLGFDRHWIGEVERLEPGDAASLTPAQRAVQHFALAAVDGRRDTGSALLDVVVDAIGARDAVAVLMLVGRYMAHATIVNALNLAPPVPSIFAAVER